MSGWQALDQFLQTDPQDVGCDRAMEILDIYVDVVIRQGTDATERRYPGVAAHLRACGPCGELRRPARGRQLTHVADVTGRDSQFGRLKHEWAMLPLRVRRLARVRLHVDLTVLTKLASALLTARTPRGHRTDSRPAPRRWGLHHARTPTTGRSGWFRGRSAQANGH